MYPLAWLLLVHLLYYWLCVRLGATPVAWGAPQGHVAGPLYTLTAMMFVLGVGFFFWMQLVILWSALLCAGAVRNYRQMLLAASAIPTWATAIASIFVSTPAMNYWMLCTFD